MATRAAMAAIPSGLRKVYRRFEHWRSAHTGRLPIPEDLWASAAEVAKEHGVFRTAQCLRLEYSKLKRTAGLSIPPPTCARSPAVPLILRRSFHVLDD